jgi:hypothetical protein
VVQARLSGLYGCCMPCPRKQLVISSCLNRCHMLVRGCSMVCDLRDASNVLQVHQLMVCI